MNENNKYADHERKNSGLSDCKSIQKEKTLPIISARTNFRIYPNSLEPYYSFVDRTKQMRFYHFYKPVTIIVDGVHIEANENSCIFHPLQKTFFYKCGQPNYHDYIMFSTDMREKLLEYGLIPGEIYYPKNISAISSVIEHLSVETISNDNYSYYYMSAKIEELFIYLARGISIKDISTEKEAVAAAFLFQDILLYVRDHLDLSYTVKELAQMACMSETNFYKTFLKLYRTSPKQYLINTKISIAKAKLLDSNIKIEDLAHQLGYTNEFHFIKQFKQHVGISPGQFAKENRILAAKSNTQFASRQAKDIPQKL